MYDKYIYMWNVCDCAAPCDRSEMKEAQKWRRHGMHIVSMHSTAHTRQYPIGTFARGRDSVDESVPGVSRLYHTHTHTQ